MAQKNENSVVAGVAFVAFAQLIVKSSGWDQMRREVLKDAVYGVFMNNLVKSLEEAPVHATQDLLKALFIVLRGNLKSRIPVERLLRILLGAMDRTQQVRGKAGLKIYQDAARCVPLIIDSGSTWAALLEQVSVAMHHILGRLYEGYDDEVSTVRHLLPKVSLGDAGAQKPLIIELWSLDSESRIDVTVALHRVTVLSHMLQFLMAAPLNFSVDVPVLDLLVVVRHLLLLDGTRASPALNGLQASDVLLAAPILHQCAHLVLETMIRQFKSRLFPFVVPVCDIVMFELSATRNAVASPALASPDVQSSLHRLVTSLIEVFQGAVTGICGAALQICLDDLQLDHASSSAPGATGAYAAPNAANAAISSSSSSNDATTSKANTQTKQNPNKKKAAAKALSDPRAHINAEALTAAAGPEAAIASKPDFLRLSSLRCLQTAFTHLGAQLDDELRASIDKTIIGLCITMTRHRNLPLWRKAAFEPAFANAQIRLGLYKVLLASSISTGRLQTPALPFAVEYLSAGCNDPDASVAAACTEALSVVHTVMHPRVPLLPPSIVDEQRTSKLSVAGILAHQSEQLLLQQHEERTLQLLQRSGRRSREGDYDDLDDERPAKKFSPAMNVDGSSSESNGKKGVEKSNVPSFLDTMSQVGAEAQQRGESIANTASALAPPSEHTVLFKSDENSKPKKAEAATATSGSAGMDVDVDIVDDGPDSEDEDM